jgi:hypothetical protein
MERDMGKVDNCVVAVHQHAHLAFGRSIARQEKQKK